MNKRLKQKLAYYIVATSFNYETSSTADVLKGMGLDVSEDDVAGITDLAADVFDSYLKKSDGWEALVPAKSAVSP